MGKYESIQLYAFNVRTNPPRTVGRVIGGDRRDAKSREEEIIIRIQALVKAATVLRKINGGANDPAALKILMAPEFYFRPEDGAYTYEEFLFAKEQLYAAGFAHHEWSNWLIVAGTIVSAEPHRAMPEYIGFNTALVIQGGQNAFVTYEKDQFSHIDGMERFIEGWAAATQDPYIRQYMFSNTKNYFSIDGINFGIEICLDHGLGIMTRQGRNVDVHLITACGMPVDWDNVMGSVVFRVDGQNYGDPAKFSSGFVGGKPLGYNPQDISDDVFHSGINVASGLDLNTPVILDIYEPIPVSDFKTEVETMDIESDFNGGEGSAGNHGGGEGMET